MGNKNKTVSFRVNEDSFGELRDIAERRDLSLSAIFRDYVDMIIAHEGHVTVAPAHAVESDETGLPGEFPPKVTVPKSFVREHERLELEADHLRDQLDEYKRYVSKLRTELEDAEREEVIQLEDLDESDQETTFRIG